jgi:hypothetical protein
MANSTSHTDARTSAALCRGHRARAGGRGRYAASRQRVCHGTVCIVHEDTSFRFGRESCEGV